MAKSAKCQGRRRVSLLLMVLMVHLCCLQRKAGDEARVLHGGKNQAVHEANLMVGSGGGVGGMHESIEGGSGSTSAVIVSGENSIDVLNSLHDFSHLGDSEYNRGNLTQAFRYYKSSYILATRLDDKREIAGALVNMGIVSYYQGDYYQAADSCGGALRLWETLRDKSQMAFVLLCVGNIQYSQGSYDQALQMYMRSQRLAEQVNDRNTLIYSLGNQGFVYYGLGNLERALSCHKAALKMALRGGTVASAVIPMLNSAQVELRMGRYPEALAMLDRAVKMAKALGSTTLQGLILRVQGEAQFSLNNLAEARVLLDRSISLAKDSNSRKDMASVLCSLADVEYSSDKYEAALADASQAAFLSMRMNNPEIFWRARLVEGKAHRKLGQSGKAAECFMQAIECIEKWRSRIPASQLDMMRFFENKASPYYEALDLAVSQGQQRKALALAEQARARVLQDSLRSERALSARTLSAREERYREALYQRVVSLNAELFREKVGEAGQAQRIASLEKNLEEARVGYESNLTVLYSKYPNLQSDRVESPPLSLEQISSLINGDASILEFAVLDDKTYLFVISRDGSSSRLDVYTISIAKSELARMVNGFRARLANMDYEFQEYSQKLYGLLLNQASRQIAGKKHLIICPDGPLWELPFQALQSGENRYLIESTAVSLIPSVASLRRIRKLQRRTESIPDRNLFLGFSAVEQGEKSAHPSSLDTGFKGMLDLYPPPLSKVFVGPRATESSFKQEAPRSKIIQIAVHGILNDANPMYSQFVFSPNKDLGKEDGLLEPWEIMNLRLKADIVILSSCETARGHFEAGEGLIGLTWAFFIAGVPTIVATQWKVDSVGSSAMMLEFHRRLNDSSCPSKAEALRQAALSLLHNPEYRHPFFWAAFVALGDAG